MEKIYLVLDDNTYFGKQIKFGDLDHNIIVNYFKRNQIDTNILSLKELIKNYKNIKNSIIFVVSSQKPYHKHLIDDYYDYIALDNILIPSRECIKAHDNKGYQELYKAQKGIDSLEALYINKDVIDYEYVLNKIEYPLVLKKLDGSGSKGVMLIQNEKNLKEQIHKIKPSLHIRYFIYLKELLKNNLKKVEYFKDHENYLLQKFVPNLKNDYKVLIFFNKFYVLKRNIKKNDFRASGSGNFEFTKVSDKLLEYANNIINSFNEPFMSLDICFNGKQYYLIEYQCIHFGPYTQINSKGFYKKVNAKWKFIEKKVSLEEDIAYSLYQFILNNKII